LIKRDREVVRITDPHPASQSGAFLSTYLEPGMDKPTFCRWANYVTLVQDPATKTIRLYYSAAPSLNKFQSICPDTWYSESDDGATFTKPKKLLSLHGASSNFAPFIDPLDKEYPYKAVGGQHLRRDHHEKTGCPSRSYLNVLGVDYAGNAEDHICFGAGVYLFKSKDGKDWNVESRLPHTSRNPQGFPPPIVTGLHEGQRDGLRGISEFDSSLSVVYDYVNKTYYLYARLNMQGGVRYIQYCTSTDLKSWSPFQPLRVNNFRFSVASKHNFYYPHFFNFGNKIIGYTAFYEEGNHEQKDAGLYLMFPSKNALAERDLGEWVLSEKIKSTGFYNKEPHGPKSSRFKNEDHTVNGLVKIDNKYYLYVHENYYNYHLDKGSYIVRYEIDGSYI
jgi:hypothetical protein